MKDVVELSAGWVGPLLWHSREPGTAELDVCQTWQGLKPDRE